MLFGEMTACAANTSVAIELLADGVRTDSVMRGVAEGERLCALLERGLRARANRRSFSAAGLVAEEFVDLVTSTEVGKALVAKIGDAHGQLRRLHEGHDLGPSRLEELRDYFYALVHVLRAARPRR